MQIPHDFNEHVMVKGCATWEPKSPAKNRYETCHLLCMQHSSNESWRIIKKVTIMNIVEKTSLSV